MRQYTKFMFGVVPTMVFMLSVSHDSWASDESSKNQVLEHYQNAKTMLVAHRYCEAADSFNAASNLIPLPVLALWAGHASARCGNLVAALAAYTKATQLTPNELWFDVKQQRAQVEAAEALATLSVRVPEVVIDVAALGEPNSKVTIDGILLPPEEYGTVVHVNPGSHVVAYSKDGQFHEERFTIGEGKDRVLHLGQNDSNSKDSALRANRESASEPANQGGLPPRNNTVGAGPGSADVSAPMRPPVPSKRSYKTVTTVSATLGAMGLVAGGVMRLMALHQKSIINAHCDPRKVCDQTGMDAVSSARSLQDQGTVYLLLGAAGVTAAIGFAFAGASNTEPQASLTATVVPVGAMVGLKRTF